MMTDNDNDIQDADEENDALVLPSNTKPYGLHTDHQIELNLLRHSGETLGRSESETCSFG
jgi:hypothetical protein